MHRFCLRICRLRLLGLAVVLALVGCDSGTSRPTPSSRVEPHPNPVTTAAVPASTASYSSRTQAVISVRDADALVAVAGAIWVKTDPGHVVRIDPATNKVTDDIVVDRRAERSSYCQGIGTDGQSVWPCATLGTRTGVAQIDPATRRVVRVVPGTKVFDQLRIPATSRGLWILTSDGSQVSVVDPATGHVTSYPLGGRYQQLAARGDRVIATSSVDGSVVAIDAATGKVIKRTKLNAPLMGDLIDTDVWVDTADGLTRLDLDLHVRTVYRGITAGLGGDVFADADSVWLRESGGAIYKIDAATGRVLERIAPKNDVSAGSLIVAFGSIWTSLSEHGKVIRLSLGDS